LVLGDISEGRGESRSLGDTAGGDDGGGAGREQDAGVVGGLGGIERDASTERCRDRVGVNDGARGEHGACAQHGTGSGGTHGMRGDGLGVGDIGEVQDDARSPEDTAGGDDGGGAGREQDAGVVGGRGGIERDASSEPSGDKLVFDDCTRGGHGTCNLHGTGSRGSHWLRGDGVGVGDIGEVQGDTRSPGDTAGGDDGGGAGREQDAGVVGGRGRIERDASTEPSGDRVCVGDCARGGHGAFEDLGTGSAWAHCMRGDGLGVGDIGEVQGDARSPGIAAGSDDGGDAGREQDAGVVDGRGGIERDASTEPSGDKLGVDDSAWCGHGACEEHCTGSGRAHGMRGDGVEVGDIGEVQVDAWNPGDSAFDDNAELLGRECDAGVVCGRGGIERDASSERCGDRVGVVDGARSYHGAYSAHGTGFVGAHGMRGDGVGVGDIGEVQGDARSPGDTACGNDNW
jgi:hypothetical protein